MLPFVYNTEESSRNNRGQQNFDQRNPSQGDYDQNSQHGYNQYESREGPTSRLYSDSISSGRDAYKSDGYERKRGRSRSRSRGRGRRSRSRSRSWSRGHEVRSNRHRSRDHYRRDRSRSRSNSPRNYRRRRSRSRDWDRDRTRGRETSDKYEKPPVVPVSKLAITSMPVNIDKNMIAIALASSGYLPQDIRIMTKFDKGAGYTRSFGFIEFSDVSVATRWMDEHKGILELGDGRRLCMEYAKGEYAAPPRKSENDWICANCSMNNFIKRENCFKCGIPKESSLLLEKQGVHMAGTTPCDTILLRNLPPDCQTSTIFDSLSSYISLSAISVVQISDSRMYAFVQMKSTDEAILLLNNSYKSTIKINGKEVITTYCIQPMSKIIQQQMSMINAGNPGTLGSAPASQVNGAEVAQAAMLKAAALRHASQQVGQMLSRNAPPPQITVQPSMALPIDYSIPPPNIINTSQPPPSLGPLVAQNKNGIIGTTPTPRGVFPKYVCPNPMLFVPDNASGYYLDRVTNFFYDATTTYYYNNDAKQWCYYDATYQTYFPVEDTNSAPSTAEVSTSVIAPAQEERPREEEGSDKKKTAADVAKDMLKWAKKQEKLKVQMAVKPLAKPLDAKNAFQNSSKKKNFSSDEEEEKEEEDSMPARKTSVADAPPMPGSGSSSDYAPIEHPSSSVPSFADYNEKMERELLDEPKKMCLLCKRAFPSTDVLRKHVEKSELHAKNLETKRSEWRQEYAEIMAEEQAKEREKEFQVPKLVYRDRAKERRQQYGYDPSGYISSETALKSGRSEDSIRRESEEAASRPLDETNIGNKLLKSMGWKEGQGVGKHAQGIVAPISAERFVQGAGLGSVGSRLTGNVEASHKEKTRAALYSRYNQ
ncbi:unnamed protein product [Caenorhabditis auriculariae]|uniref:RNA-binding protein 5 n=1 Tax=Caenorhabditis auriculariae TaxID=2777116 RepID=A0A8S1HM64_9PELO|nr:unnamed protein product [Caenorhabditis auriculariae]